MKKSFKAFVLFFVITSIHVNAAGLVPCGDPKKPVTSKIHTDLVLKVKDEVIFVNLLNLDQNAVKLTVRDGLDRLVFSEVISDKKVIQKLFNFSKAYKGSYTIKVEDGATTYMKEIDIG